MADDLYGSPEHQLFRRTVREFVQEELPRAREFDEMARALRVSLPSNSARIGHAAGRRDTS
jgi:hypothetical protein